MEDVNVNYNFPPKPFVYKPNVRYTKGVKGFGVQKGAKGAQGPSGGSGTVFGTFSTANSNSRCYSNNSITYTSNISSTNTSSVHFGSDIFISSSNVQAPGVFATEKDLSTIETGRIEKGDVSNQTLKALNAQFSNTAFYSIEYKILPFSEMNSTSNEIRQYCSNCGYRLRKDSWKFCPKCGEKI
jgi:hypothetical protein